MKLYSSNLPWILLLVSLLLDLLFQNLFPRLFCGQELRRDPPSALLAPDSRYRPIFCCWTGIFCVASAFAAITLFESFLPVSFGWCVPLLTGYALFVTFLAVTAFSPREGERKRGGKLRNAQFHQDTANAAPFMLLLVTLPLGVLLLLDGRVLPGVISLVCFAPQTFCAVAYVLGKKPRYSNRVFAQPGLWVRLAALFGYLPLCAFALTVLLQPR